MSTTKSLTPKQERFILEYAKDFNATQAAIRAGYKGKYIDRTAHQLLEKTRDLIEARKAEMRKTGIATLEQTLRLCTAMAFYDPRKLFDTHGNCREIPELTALGAKAVAGFEIEELFDGKGESRKKIGYVRKCRLADRAPYVNMLLKHLGAFPSKQLPAPQAPTAPRFDLSQLTDEELREHMRLRRKAMVQIEDQR